jgi:hydrogenase maturation protease
MRTLLLTWGNPAREDDGLGPAVAAAVERWGLPGVSVSCDYQLQVEDACQIAAHDRVIFVDAATEGPAPFGFQPVEPIDQAGFSSHSVRAEALLGLTARCFGAEVPAWMLAIRGHSFAPFVEVLTPQGQAHLAAALAFLERLLRDDEPWRTVPAPEPEPAP